MQKSETRSQKTLETKSGGVCTLNRDNRIEYESEFARKSLQKYFASEKAAPGFLPNSLGRWLEHELCKMHNDHISRPPQIYKVEKKNETLEVRLMHAIQTNEITLLIEETTNPSAKMPEHLNLTRRESETLFWISQGKTDKDIAVLFGISPRTVHKHTENIYVKLGVETRTAAMLRAFETP